MSTPGQAEAFMWLAAIGVAIMLAVVIAFIFSPVVTGVLITAYLLYLHFTKK